MPKSKASKKAVLHKKRAAKPQLAVSDMSSTENSEDFREEDEPRSVLMEKRSSKDLSDFLLEVEDGSSSSKEAVEVSNGRTGHSSADKDFVQKSAQATACQLKSSNVASIPGAPPAASVLAASKPQVATHSVPDLATQGASAHAQNVLNAQTGQLSFEITTSLLSMEREDEDLTLKLVDDLLLCIFGFLPIKDALRMSVLSTRWRHMCTSFSNIDLDDTIAFFNNRPPDYPRCRTSFLHFVDRLLLGHDDSVITSFKVYCDVRVDAARVHSWITALVRHNVKELYLRFPLTEAYILPTCLFSSQSLTTLSITLYGVLGFPSSLSGVCPCLKSLYLSRIKFLNEESTNNLFSKLFSVFPNLQHLSLVRCGWKNIKHLVIPGFSLRSITMEDSNFDETLYCNVLVFAPKLTSFNCQTDCSIGVILHCSPPLMDASLRFCFPRECQQLLVYYRLEKLLRKIGGSKRLSLSPETLESRRFYVRIPVLENLTYLDISGLIRGTTIEDILELMQKTPNLEYLCTYLYVLSYDDDDDLWSAPPAPRCLMNKFKNLKVICLDGSRSKIHLVKFFLENAPNLETIEVCAPLYEEEKLGTVRTELEALPRCSKKCAFVFEIIDSLPDD